MNGDKQNSDIRWNAWSGTFNIQVVDSQGQLILNPFYAEVNPFTGNCGIKSVSHLRFQGDAEMSAKEKTKYRKTILDIFEGFLYHACNAGIVLGSDSGTDKKFYTNGTGDIIETYGEDYKFGDWVWNPNYTWSKEHKVKVFSKKLVGQKYPDVLWSQINTQQKSAS